MDDAKRGSPQRDKTHMKKQTRAWKRQRGKKKQRRAKYKVATLFRTSKTCAPYAPDSNYPSGKWRSDAQKRINEVPPILVKGSTAVCDGGGGALGHPMQYIQLDTVDGQPQVCKYCGLRYAMAPGHHHHH